MAFLPFAHCSNLHRRSAVVSFSLSFSLKQSLLWFACKKRRLAAESRDDGFGRVKETRETVAKCND